jgi:hypothetical protein
MEERKTLIIKYMAPETLISGHVKNAAAYLKSIFHL